MGMEFTIFIWMGKGKNNTMDSSKTITWIAYSQIKSQTILRCKDTLGIL